MKRNLYLIILFFCIPMVVWAIDPVLPAPAKYKLIVEGFDWGPAVSKVILPVDQSPNELNMADFEVYVSRSSSLGEIPAAQTSGKRTVVYAYPSDENGNRM